MEKSGKVHGAFSFKKFLITNDDIYTVSFKEIAGDIAIAAISIYLFNALLKKMLWGIFVIGEALFSKL